jgi:RHS repeat-associated protein
MTSMTYPNGRVINYNYASGLDTAISRLSSITDTSGTLESYKYLGLSTIVEMDHPETGVNLTYITQSGGTGDAGDKYIGLDRFGRVVDQNWYSPSTSTSTDDFQYGYDRDSNVLFMKNTVSTTNSELYGYNGLNELTSFKRGTLNGTNTAITGTPSVDESWGLDAVGNWTSVTTNGSTQTRTANADNQITSISGLTTPAYDGNGNTTTDQAGKTLVYDAWNRLVKYKNGSTVLETGAYDALGRKAIENAGTATDIYFSQSWQDIEEDVSGAARLQYVWGAGYIDHLVERDRDADGNTGNGLEEKLFPQQNANWDVTALVNTNALVQERYQSDPYGAVTILTGTWGSRSTSSYAWVVFHQGGRLDTTTGLYAFRNRMYSTTLGKWMQEDPAMYRALDLNVYRILGNNPISRLDPTGLDWHWYNPWSWWGPAKSTDAICDCLSFGKKFRQYEKECKQEIKEIGIISFFEKYDGNQILSTVSRGEQRNFELHCILEHAKQNGEDMDKFRAGFESCVRAILGLPLTYQLHFWGRQLDKTKVIVHGTCVLWIQIEVESASKAF